MSQPTVKQQIAKLETAVFASFAELRDAMLHGFAQSEARDNALGADIARLNNKHDRLETRVEHIETDVGILKNDVGSLKTDMSQVKRWIARKDTKRR